MRAARRLRDLPAKGRCLTRRQPPRSLAGSTKTFSIVIARGWRAQANDAASFRHRRASVRHLKCRAGYRHFLVRGFNKVRGEWSLMALCYNFTRVLNILGFERFIARVAKALVFFQNALVAAKDCVQFVLQAFRLLFASPNPARQLRSVQVR